MLLESHKNIGDSILYLYPNAKVNEDFTVINDGQFFKLMEWNLSDPAPTLDQLESVFDQAQAGRNQTPVNEVEELKRKQDLIQSALDDIILGGAL